MVDHWLIRSWLLGIEKILLSIWLTIRISKYKPVSNFDSVVDQQLVSSWSLVDQKLIGGGCVVCQMNLAHYITNLLNHWTIANKLLINRLSVVDHWRIIERGNIQKYIHEIFRNRARLFQQDSAEDNLCPNQACRREHLSQYIEHIFCSCYKVRAAWQWTRRKMLVLL